MSNDILVFGTHLGKDYLKYDVMSIMPIGNKLIVEVLDESEES